MKRTSQLVNFAVILNHKVKFKDSEKLDKHLDLTIKLYELWNLKMTVIPIRVGILWTIRKKLENVVIGSNPKKALGS